MKLAKVRRTSQRLNVPVVRVFCVLVCIFSSLFLVSAVRFDYTYNQAATQKWTSHSTLDGRDESPMNWVSAIICMQDSHTYDWATTLKYAHSTLAGRVESPINWVLVRHTHLFPALVVRQLLIAKDQRTASMLQSRLANAGYNMACLRPITFHCLHETAPRKHSEDTFIPQSSPEPLGILLQGHLIWQHAGLDETSPIGQ